MFINRHNLEYQEPLFTGYVLYEIERPKKVKNSTL